VKVDAFPCTRLTWASSISPREIRSTNVDMVQPVEDAEDIEQPQDHHDHDDAIENRFNVALHGDEPIDEPEQNAHNDQGKNEVHKRH